MEENHIDVVLYKSVAHHRGCCEVNLLQVPIKNSAEVRI